jgi:excisionase family DNA binding protein
MINSEYYTPIEAAHILRVCRLTIYRYLKSGKLPSVKPAGMRLIKKTDLEKFIDGEKG